MCACDSGFVCAVCAELEEQRDEHAFNQEERDDEYDRDQRARDWSLEVRP